MTIAELYRRCKSINIDELKSNVIESISGKMITRQQERIFSGMNADGSEIKPDYSPVTIFLKQADEQPFDRVTLKDTGSFYDSMFIKKEGDDVLFDSDDSKSEELKAKYGEKIFGQGEAEKEANKADARDKIIEFIELKLGI